MNLERYRVIVKLNANDILTNYFNSHISALQYARKMKERNPLRITVSKRFETFNSKVVYHIIYIYEEAKVGRY